MPILRIYILELRQPDSGLLGHRSWGVSQSQSVKYQSQGSLNLVEETLRVLSLRFKFHSFYNFKDLLWLGFEWEKLKLKLKRTLEGSLSDGSREITGYVISFGDALACQ